LNLELIDVLTVSWFDDGLQPTSIMSGASHVGEWGISERADDGIWDMWDNLGKFVGES
jgi:hypothetical protein